jgi:hypothetical protein
MARTPRRWLRLLLKSLAWIVGTLLALILIVVAIGAYGRWRGPDAQGRAALVLIQAPQMQPAGNNAFPILWLWRWPVPDAQLQAVTDADMSRLRRLSEGPTHNPAWAQVHGDHAAILALINYQTEARQRWPGDRAAIATDLCPIISNSGPLDCIAFVQAHPARVAAALAASRTALHHATQLQHTQYLWSELPATPLQPMASLFAPEELAQVALTADAQHFLAGDTQAALTDVCRSAVTWRRLYGNSNNRLLATDVAQQNAGASLQLMAAMLARLPATAPIPPQCLQATAPLAAREVNLCAASQRSFAKHVLFFKEMGRAGADSLGEHLLARLVFDPHLDSAYYARLDAPFCQPGFVTRVLANPQAIAMTPLPHIGVAACVGSIFTCMQNHGAFAPGNRQLFAWPVLQTSNLAAHIRLAAAVLALHQKTDAAAGMPLASRYAALPAALRSVHHHAGVSADGHALYVQDLRTPGFPARRFELSVVTPSPHPASASMPSAQPASRPAQPQRSR